MRHAAAFSRVAGRGGNLLTQFIASVPARDMAVERTIADEDEMMCSRSVEVLCFPALLADPLVRMAMASDGVNEQEMRALLQHVSELIAQRDVPEQASACRTAEPVGQL